MNKCLLDGRKFALVQFSPDNDTCASVYEWGGGESFPELEKGPGAEDKDPRLNRCRNAFQGLTKTHKSDPEGGDINGLGEITPGKNFMKTAPDWLRIRSRA